MTGLVEPAKRLPEFLPEGETGTIWDFEDKHGGITRWRHATKAQWDAASEGSREIMLMQVGGICFVVRA